MLPDGISEDKAISEHLDSGCKLHVKKNVEKQRRDESRCSYGKGKKRCKDSSLIKIMCDGCDQLFCVKHRQKSVHKCAGVPVIKPSSTSNQCRPCAPQSTARPSNPVPPPAPAALVRKLSQDLVRVASDKSLRSPKSGQQPPSSAESANTNACPTCTFINPPGATVCEMCGGELSMGASEAGKHKASEEADRLQAALKALDEEEAEALLQLREEFNNRRARVMQEFGVANEH